MKWITKLSSILALAVGIGHRAVLPASGSAEDPYHAVIVRGTTGSRFAPDTTSFGSDHSTSPQVGAYSTKHYRFDTFDTPTVKGPPSPRFEEKCMLQSLTFTGPIFECTELLLEFDKLERKMRYFEIREFALAVASQKERPKLWSDALFVGGDRINEFLGEGYDKFIRIKAEVIPYYLCTCDRMSFTEKDSLLKQELQLKRCKSFDSDLEIIISQPMTKKVLINELFEQHLGFGKEPLLPEELLSTLSEGKIQERSTVLH
jgi:hypothetical protein